MLECLDCGLRKETENVPGNGPKRNKLFELRPQICGGEMRATTGPKRIKREDRRPNMLHILLPNIWGMLDKTVRVSPVSRSESAQTHNQNGLVSRSQWKWLAGTNWHRVQERVKYRPS